MLSQGGKLAERLIREKGQNPEAWIERGWELTVGRPPSAGEKEDALRFFSKDASMATLTRFCLVLFNLNEFLYVD